MKFICQKCGKEYTEDDYKWRCDCGGYLVAEYESAITKEDIKKERLNMWRYDAAYPIKYEDLKVTYNEGMTPLVRVSGAECSLRIKMDSLMPTGSFKDRGTVMVVNYLLNHGVTKITEDSSGNAGASVAGYCALGKIDCDIYIPEGTSYGKTVQIRAYGANVYEIGGTREDVAAAAQKDQRSYAGHNWHPLFIEGTKSLAYELWEQNRFEAPENIISVAGNGSVILGIYNGFKTLLRCGQIKKMPRLFVAQAENCNPIYRLYKGMSADLSYQKTIAEGIALTRPNKAQMVVDAVRDTNGEVVAVSEREIMEAVKDEAKLGFFVEPTSATAYAGLRKLIKERVLSARDDVIMLVSGNGLKASNEIAELMEQGDE